MLSHDNSVDLYSYFAIDEKKKLTVEKFISSVAWWVIKVNHINVRVLIAMFINLGIMLIDVNLVLCILTARGGA